MCITARSLEYPAPICSQYMMQLENNSVFYQRMQNQITSSTAHNPGTWNDSIKSPPANSIIRTRRSDPTASKVQINMLRIRLNQSLCNYFCPSFPGNDPELPLSVEIRLANCIQKKLSDDPTQLSKAPFPTVHIDPSTMF